MRQVLRQGQALGAHLQQPPDWALHFARLDEIERLFRSGTPEDLQRMAALNEDFLLGMNADMAVSVAEATGRLGGFTDEVARRVEEKKFEMPSDVRDGMEDFLSPTTTASARRCSAKSPSKSAASSSPRRPAQRSVLNPPCPFLTPEASWKAGGRFHPV